MWPLDTLIMVSLGVLCLGIFFFLLRRMKSEKKLNWPLFTVLALGCLLIIIALRPPRLIKVGPNCLEMQWELAKVLDVLEAYVAKSELKTQPMTKPYWAILNKNKKKGKSIENPNAVQISIENPNAAKISIENPNAAKTSIENPNAAKTSIENPNAVQTSIVNKKIESLLIEEYGAEEGKKLMEYYKKTRQKIKIK